MITDWPIQTFSRQSAITGKTFEAGDRVICLLVETVESGLQRMDILEEERNALPPTSSILAKWNRTVRTAASSSASDQAKQNLLSSEELFFSMAESLATGDDSSSSSEGDAAAILFLLSIHLERQRILRSRRASSTPAFICFTHIRSKRNFQIPTVDLTPGQMARIHDKLDMLFQEANPGTPNP